MSAPLPQSDEALQDLAIEQTRTGNIETAKLTASQITDATFQRRAWMQILYTQLYELKDLRGVKETVLSLSDRSLWIGSWVHDLVLFTAKSGDIDGAMTFVNKLPGDSPHGHFLTLIASAQAHHGDYHGAKSTLATLEPDNPWRELGLIFIIREMVKRGDRAEADVIANQVVDPQIKASALKLCTSPPTEPKS